MRFAVKATRQPGRGVVDRHGGTVRDQRVGDVRHRQV